MAKIRVDIPGVTSQEYEVKDEMTIGRLSKNDITLKVSAASREHARIYLEDGYFFIEDLASSNGTYFLKKGKPRNIERKGLEDGDVIQIGTAILTFIDKAPDALVGKNIANHEMVERVGHGGMGIVYKAKQLSMDRIVAMKLLSKKLTSKPKFVETFKNEAKTAGQFNHPNIIRVHDFGEFNGIYWYSMEYVNGEDLMDIINREQKMSVKRSLDIIYDVAKALEHAWKFRIIHKDIKPHNIMIDDHGEVKLADLGLAETAENEAVHRAGEKKVVMGTPHYMSPEQARAGDLDIRTDIYALGGTFYNMVTGKTPFDGTGTKTLIVQHASKRRPNIKDHIPDLPNSIQELFEKMMAIDRNDRPGDPTALLGMIKSVIEKESTWLFENDAQSPNIVNEEPSVVPSPVVEPAPAIQPQVPDAPVAVEEQSPQESERPKRKEKISLGYLIFVAALIGLIVWLNPIETFKNYGKPKTESTENDGNSEQSSTNQDDSMPIPVLDADLPEDGISINENMVFAENFTLDEFKTSKQKWNNFRVYSGEWEINNDSLWMSKENTNIIPRIEIRNNMYDAEGISTSIDVELIEKHSYAGLELLSKNGKSIGVRVGKKRISIISLVPGKDPVQKIIGLDDELDMPVKFGFVLNNGRLAGLLNGEEIENLSIDNVETFRGLINIKASKARVSFDNLEINPSK